MIEMREFLDNNGGKDIEVIAKIENRQGIDNIDDARKTISTTAALTFRTVDGELLKRVYSKDIINGIFIVPEHIKSINMFAFSHLQNTPR